MNIYTYHSYKSLQSGGVESFIRFLQESFIQNIGRGFVFEIYHFEPQKQIHSESPLVEYIKLPSYSIGRLGKYARKIHFFMFLNCSKRLEKGDVLIITQVRDLLFISHRLFKKCKVILVQTNRLDVWLYSMFNRIIGKKIQACRGITVYTPLDNINLTNFLSKKDINVDIFEIPRACRVTAKKLHKNAHLKRLIFIGRLDEKQKNISGLFKLMDLLPSDISLIIYGDGSPRDVEKVKKEVERRNNVKYKGVCIDVQQALSHADVFVMTSFYEGFGQTLIEARSQGVPSIVFNTFDAANWILKGGQCGVLIEPFDYAAMADAITKTFEGSDYIRMSKNCIFYSKETSYKIVSEKWKSLLMKSNNKAE